MSEKIEAQTEQVFYLIWPARMNEYVEIMGVDDFFNHGRDGHMENEQDAIDNHEAIQERSLSNVRPDRVTIPGDYATVDAMEAYVNQENEDRRQMWNGSQDMTNLF
jgi:hypothetical protein